MIIDGVDELMHLCRVLVWFEQLHGAVAIRERVFPFETLRLLFALARQWPNWLPFAWSYVV